MTKIVARLVFLLIVAELLLVLLSWLLSATQTEGVRSLLSSEGIRFMFGQFTYMLLKPQLVWLLLLAMAGGCVWQSGVLHPSQMAFRRRFALRVALSLLVVLMLCAASLVFIPHAVLLSSTGRIWPSPFSRALVPMASAVAIVVSSCYGLLSRTFISLHDIFSSLNWGLQQASPFIILCLLLLQFYGACCYVFL
ncbi:MAG: AbgT family transporter [Prevotella sp.]|nr:AbgT family transporter [Prevotella sp.]